MRISTIIAVAVLLGLSAIASARAEEGEPSPAARQDAARLLDAAKLFAMDATFRADTRIAARGLTFPDDLPAAAAAELAALEAKLHEKAIAPYRETLIDIYARRLSEAQLREAADFMATPAGQARSDFLQHQTTNPALHAGPAFAIDDPLLAEVAKAAAARGLSMPSQ